MKTTSLFALATAAILLCSCIRAEIGATASVGALTVRNAYVTRNVGGGTSAAYMQIENRGGTTDRLVSLATQIAGRTTLHETQNKNGLMLMVPLPNGIELPPGSTVELKTAGFHAMLEQLPRELKVGEKIPVSFKFASGASLTMSLPVREPGSDDSHIR